MSLILSHTPSPLLILVFFSCRNRHTCLQARKCTRKRRKHSFHWPGRTLGGLADLLMLGGVGSRIISNALGARFTALLPVQWSPRQLLGLTAMWLRWYFHSGQLCGRSEATLERKHSRRSTDPCWPLVSHVNTATCPDQNEAKYAGHAFHTHSVLNTFWPQCQLLMGFQRDARLTGRGMAREGTKRWRLSHFVIWEQNYTEITCQKSRNRGDKISW